MTSEKELGEALKSGQDYIEIEGDLAKKTIRIKATGKVAWGACFAFISIAVGMSVVTIASGGTATPVSGSTAAASLGLAATTLGLPTAVSATGIAIAGGVGALNKLRKYKLEKLSDTRIVLRKN